MNNKDIWEMSELDLGGGWGSGIPHATQAPPNNHTPFDTPLRTT